MDLYCHCQPINPPSSILIGEYVTQFTLGRVDFKLTRYLIHRNKITVLLFYFWSVSGDEENSKERQKAAGKEF